MVSYRKITRESARWGGVALVALLASCGYAKRSQVDSEFARLREEMRSGDQALAGRVDQLDGRMSAMERDLQALRSEFNVTVQKLEGLLAFDVPVHFDFASSDVRDSDRAVLERFAAVVKAYYPNALVTVEGFTDPAGSVAYNLKLGKARADAVKGYLTSTGGLDPERVRSVSYGKDPKRLVAPKGKGPGAAGMPNRRVTLVIDYTDAAGSASTVAPVTD
jgi:peptidoglycan-associated lipoprotein